MNDLEARIYSDAARTAAEVTPADIPLYQTGRFSASGTGASGTGASRSGSGRAGQGRTGSPAVRWSGGRSGAGAGRILAPVAAAVSVAGLAAAAILLTAGPGTAPHHGNGHRTTSPQPAQTKPARPANRALANQALDAYFPASGATYTNGLAFNWAEAKATAHDIDPCLAAAGFPQPAFTGSVHLYQLSFGDLSQFPDLAQLRASPGDHYFTKQYLVLRHSTPARQRALNRAQARCTARFARAVTRVDKAADHLEGVWLGIISRIEHSRPVTATQPAFAKCLQAHGVPANFATQTDQSADNPLFTGFFAWGDYNTQTATSSSQQAQDRRRANRVFLACAPPVVTVLERLQLHERAQFFRAHAAEIAHIARLATRITDRS